MKKIYLLIAAGAIVVSANAQKATNTVHGTPMHKAPWMKSMEGRAAGDTIMFYDSDFYMGAGVDGTFGLQTEDVDLLTPYQPTAPMDFARYYSLAAWDFISTDVNDSAFFFGATSWFNPAGQADNWLEMGPITLPATGATLSWYVKNNPGYRDGYEVLINTGGMDYTNFGDPNIYSRTDLATDPVVVAGDTTWTQITANIPAMYLGQPIFIAWHHTANDQDVIYFDNFLVKEAPVSVSELNNDFTMSEVFPNPFNTNANFNINLTNASDVSYMITDLSGKVLVNQTEFNVPAGNNRINISADGMSSGMYYINVTAGNSKVTKKLQVVK